MRSGSARGEDGAPGVTRRVVRLLVLLGVVLAVYLVLMIFDHAARADTGSTDHIGSADPVASVKATTGDLVASAKGAAAGAKKSVAKAQPVIPQATAPKAHPLKIHQSTIKVPEAGRPKVQVPKKIHATRTSEAKKVQVSKVRDAPKVHASKILEPSRVPTVSAKIGATVRRVQVRTVKVGEPASDVVRNAARTVVTPIQAAVVRQKLPTSTQVPALSQLPGLPQAQLPTWPQLQSWPQLPGRPQAEFPLPLPSHLSGAPQSPGLSRTPSPDLSQKAAVTGVSLPGQPLRSPVSAQECRLSQAPESGPASSTAAHAQLPTTPHPVPPRQPADSSTLAGQARDSGSGNASAMATVSSSWRPEVAAAGCRLSTDLFARGRTVRYAGPPS